MPDPTPSPTPGRPTRPRPSLKERLLPRPPVRTLPSGGFTPRQRRLIRGFQVRSSAGTQLLITALVLLILHWIFNRTPETFGAFRQDALGGALLIRFLDQVLALLIPAAVVVVIYRLGNPRVIGRRSPSLDTRILALLVGIPTGLVLIGLNNLYAFALSLLGLRAQPTFTYFRLTPQGPVDAALLILVVAVLPAILEEVLFRGILISGASVTGRHAWAILLQAMAFAFFYPWGLALPAAFLLALLLGYLRKKSDHLSLCILTRLTVNLTLLFATRVLPLMTRETNMGGQEGRTLLYASVIALIIAVLMLLPVFAMLVSALSREIRLAHTATTRLNTRQRTLMPRRADRTPEGAAEPTPAGDPYVLPAAAHIWFPTDWKFNLSLVILWILYWVR